MPDVTCPPNSDVAGVYTSLIGGATVNDCWQPSALPNASKAEYVEFTGTTFGTLQFTVGLDNSAIPDGVTITSAILIVYAANLNPIAGGLRKFLIKARCSLNTIDFNAGGGSGWMPSEINDNDLSFADLTSSIFPLTKAEIGNIAVGIDTVGVSGGGIPATLYVYQVYLIVTYTTDSADITITGSGGVIVNGEAVLPIMITGSGGVAVGSSGGSTPIVLSKDPSGMYTLVPDQHFDRVFTRNIDPDDTTDVAVPTPFAKTGYFGG